MSTVRWSGIITGLVTPFGPEGEVDYASLESHLQHLSCAPLAGILTSAVMGEGGHLTREERQSILKFTIARVTEDTAVIATIYGNNTSEAANEARTAAELGAKALLVFPHPAFSGAPLDPEVPAAYFRAIWNAARLPMIVFRTPDTLAPKFGLDVLKTLVGIPGVAAIKDSAAEREFYTGGALRFLRENSDVKVLIDHDLQMVEFLRLGADGATSICAAAYPNEYASILATAQTVEADSDMAAVRPFAQAVFAAPFRDFRARLKCALKAQKVIATDHVRAPLLPLASSEQLAIKEIVRSFQGPETRARS